MDVENYYDRARGMGIDLLKLCLQVAIALNVLPMIFYERISVVFPGALIYLIYASWVCILLSVLVGFVAYFLIFEGFYHQAHYEWERQINKSESAINKKWKKFNRFFAVSHYIGMGGLALFGSGVFCIVAAVILKACK